MCKCMYEYYSLSLKVWFDVAVVVAAGQLNLGKHARPLSLPPPPPSYFPAIIDVSSFVLALLAKREGQQESKKERP